MLGRRASPKGVARGASPTLAIYSRLLAIAYLSVKSITRNDIHNWAKVWIKHTEYTISLKYSCWANDHNIGLQI